MTVRNGVVGLVILLLAVVICWGVVAIGQAQVSQWTLALLGEQRAQTDPAMAEAVFNGFIFGPLILVALVGAAIDRRNAFAPGRRWPAMLALGLVVGLVGLSASALYAKLAGSVSPGQGVPMVAPVLLMGLGVVAVQTIAEELFFRGWLQPALAKRWGTVAAVIAGALAFSVLHIVGGARAPISLLNLFLGGLMFGLFAARTGGIAAAVGAHFAWNGAEQLLFGLDPNGQDGAWASSFGTVMDWDLRGSAIWGGSPDGLNGSIGMTVALLAILVPLAASLWAQPRAGAAAAPATAPALSPSALPG